MNNQLKVLAPIIATLAAIAVVSAGPKNPHKNLKYECEDCHSTASFENVRFDHERTGFELTERHEEAKCSGCHEIAEFSLRGQGCVSCHSDVHEAKLGSDCVRCHTTRDWRILNMEEIHLESDFAFSGVHTRIECSACHPGLPRGDMLSTLTRCVDCHQQEYLEIADPNHVTAGFSTDCQDCHQMNTWRPALLEDHEPFFPIFSGAHRGEWTQCATCHTTSNSYNNFSCFDCHGHPQDKTDAALPGITGYSYTSQACYDCHPDGKASRFVEHDALHFPIYSGSHLNRWDNCSGCHTSAANPAAFDCLPCHTNPETDNFHQGFPGYAYNSPDCLQCHPDGQAGSFVDHEPMFPIFSGKHNGEWQSCADCHTVPAQRSVFSCVEGCHQHPQSEMDDKHQDETGYVSNGTVCMDCHANGTK